MVKDEQFAFARYGEDNTEVGVLSDMNFLKECLGKDIKSRNFRFLT